MQIRRSTTSFQQNLTFEIQKPSLSSPFLIIGMLNGMIGGVILVLPLLVLQAGTVGSGLIIFVSGVFSYYSCMLCVKHLGKYQDLDKAIMAHFNNNHAMKIFYDIIIFLNLFLLLILYFKLITQQWQGMVNAPTAIAIVNFFILILLVIVMKYFEFGVSFLAYGIISCVGYCIFLIWMFASAPSGDNKMKFFGSGAVTLAASMGQAFSIQTIFIPILRKNKNQQNYQQYTAVTFICGFCIYMYIAYMGSYGILNRKPAQSNPQTIEQYFPIGYWQLYCLQIIYLVHLYSVFPQFLLISNKRLFSVFKEPITKKGTISWKQILYAVSVIAVCLIVSLSNVQIGDIIQLNGAVVGFFFIYFLPVVLHFKCVYYQDAKKAVIALIYTNGNNQGNNVGSSNSKKKQIEITNMPSQQNIGIESEQKSMRETLLSQKQQNQAYNKNKIQQNNTKITKQRQNQHIYIDIYHYQCDAVKPPLIYAVFDMFMLLSMLATGIFIMYRGMYNVFT